MITKQEILSIATEAKLQPTTVERDYVLSWVLYGISKHSQLSQWIFKGGTCLKKCYFETYRFSEDLDFTIPKNAIYTQEEIKKALEEVAVGVYEQTGINAQTREVEVEESFNKKKSKTFIAKMTYLGPLNLPSKSQQRIKFDITDDEVIAEDPDLRDVFHPYSDGPEIPAKVRCYSVNEILAEKTRAMYERQGRARDVFDVVNISRNFREDVTIARARSAVKKKFHFKELSDPSVDLVFSQIDLAQLRANWDGQLRHQLPVLPSVESFYDDLRSALSWWMDEVPIETKLAAIPNTQGTLVPRTHFPEAPYQFGRKGQPWAGRLDQIRYAARNRLLLEVKYQGVTRLVEPYSLRRPNTGNLLFYVFEQRRAMATSSQIKAYKIAEIADVRITEQAFTPRYAIEL